MFSRHGPLPSTPSTRDRNNPPASTQRSLPSRSTAVPLHGLFVNGKWHCNCEPRRWADHFQTKNGGKNHGRWFYTCPKPQGMRCNFFLWGEEAVIRERDMAKVLKSPEAEAGAGATGYSTSKTIGSGVVSKTPSRPLAQAFIDTRTGLLTPRSATKKRSRDYEQGYGYRLNSVSELGSPSKKSRVEGVSIKREDEEEIGGEDDSFGWDDGIDENFGEQFVRQESSRQTQEQDIFRLITPRKSPGWFRDGRGLFVSKDEGDGARGTCRDGSAHGERNKDPAGLDDPFGPVPSTRLFASHQRPSLTPSTSLPRPPTPQTTCSIFTYGQDTATTPPRTTIADPSDLASPPTPTPIRYPSTPLLHSDSIPSVATPSVISSTTTSTISPQKTRTIVSNTLAVLSKHDIALSPAAKRELVTLLNTEYLHTQAIINGRDVSRAAVQNRDAQIQTLRGRIAVLEAEREGFRLGKLSRDSARFESPERVEERDDG
ncbi:tRNA methyltransferase Trm5 [Histoplasma capsulatum var. duboisii H88]|uniref:tRNA methyltransferase Trm5 n=1 Tax=Ajellomyces capsulatus (strain H88) TaxID=544711 RepID=A0A8A1LIQ3_AJEC8|nr:tRNA methyltransferase Trm5 [Histoplasma capsulatum var. duboisii H88]